MLYLFRIAQKKVSGYDTFDSAVVVAVSEEEATRTHPSGYFWSARKECWQYQREDGDLVNDVGDGTWSSPEDVTATKLGPLGNTAFKAGSILCASFNAG